MAHREQATGYDKLVSHRKLAVAAGAFAALLVVPLPGSVLDVGVEYALGQAHVYEFYAGELFQRRYEDLEGWQAAGVRVLEASMRQGASRRARVLDGGWDRARKLDTGITRPQLERFTAALAAWTDEPFFDLMQRARRLRHDELTYERLSAPERAQADEAARKVRVCLALVAFVVICFVTEAIPLPGVAFCIGLILVLSGIVSRREVAGLFWSDACWFIMGSLMFAAAFVKTGVDKRICLTCFRALARPSVGAITAIFILVISPAASFISDHALAAMFLPIGLILYSNTTAATGRPDRELARLLMICIAMACNIGGFGAPSGGARNVIIMTYMEDMFGVTVGYGEWILYGMPFVIVMMPVLWLLLRWRFKPSTTDLRPALETLRADITRMGGWSRQQVVAVAIFALMLFGWITESNLLLSLTGIRLGIGVLAVAGAVAYLLAGVVSWRDYHERVDWGVVWLYAGATIFGRLLDETGTAYWLARSVVEGLASLGLTAGPALMAVGGAVTSAMTNLMADGPAAAAVGPITLNIAAVSAPGTTLVPFMGLVTACASSFAYLLVIGTPPNAIVYASGLLEPRDFLRVGIPCLLAAFVVLAVLALLIWPILGFQGLPPA